MKVLILYYVGEGQDMDDTLEGVKAIHKALINTGHMVDIREVNNGNWREAVRMPGDVVFNLVEDESYRLYVKVAKALIKSGRIQVGNDMYGLKYLTNKTEVKRRMTEAGIPTPGFVMMKKGEPIDTGNMNFPMILKPSGQHAAVGIDQESVVTNKQKLVKRAKYLFETFTDEIVAEEYIKGRELQVTVVGNLPNLTVMPAAEIKFGQEFDKGWKIYTYQAKWDKNSWEYWAARVSCPADIGRETEKELVSVSESLYTLLGCKDVARFDVRLDEKGNIFVVDVNMCPSLNAYDDQDATVASAKAIGWSYDKLIDEVVFSAHERGAETETVAGGLSLDIQGGRV